MKKSITRSMSVYRHRNPEGDPFCYMHEKNRLLETIGLVLWTTEGDKTQLSIANGNPYIIQKYLDFLRTICNLREERIKAVIHCHDTVSFNDCVNYWSTISNIPPTRFNKPFIKKDKGGTRSYPYGILRIVASNTKLIQIFKDRLKVFGLEKG